ncbi:MAG: four helix bundle protein [Melioribacteraceae bacterium]|nr:four helix bundle protein [Melioribacteraceae bacterium]MCO6472995.1 four helix bundle protein [Melioribacteraceae bacterium]MDD3558885.1 four helix bundle protein [Melioribacteraceae bacterium]
MAEKKIKYLKLNDIEAYRISFALSNYVWNIVIKWDHFAKRTIGSQFTDAIDSISANIAEGFGRYNKKDKIRFYRISFGSMYESLDWNEKAKIRTLTSEEQYNHIYTELKKLPKAINSLINYTNTKLRI